VTSLSFKKSGTKYTANRNPEKQQIGSYNIALFSC